MALRPVQQWSCGPRERSIASPDLCNSLCLYVMQQMDAGYLSGGWHLARRCVIKVMLLRDIMPPDLVAKRPSRATLRLRFLWRTWICVFRAVAVIAVVGWIGRAS